MCKAQLYNILTEPPISKLETKKIPEDKDEVQTTQDPQIIDNSNNTVKISAPPPSSISTVSQNLQKMV